MVARLLASAPGALRFTALTGGVSSDIWRVDTGGETYCAKRALPRLRVQARWEAPVSRNTEEVRWLRTTRAWIGDQAAEVIAHDESAGVAILRWYPPERWHNWKTRLLSGIVALDVADALGRALGTIAREASRQPELAEAFDNADLFDALRVDPFFRHIGDRYPGLEALIRQLQTDRATLVHGDFSPKNVLTDDGGAIRILDAETATWGSPGFDPGYLLAHLLLKYQHRGQPALLVAAARFWSVYLAETAGCFPDLDARTYRPLVGMLLARIDGKSPVEYLSASQRKRLRGLASDLLAAPAPPPIDELLDNWSRLSGARHGG